MRGILRTVLGFSAAVLAAVSCGQTYGGDKPDRPTDLPTKPILRIEAGNHSAPIWAVATDRAGKYLVTSSNDKTVRLWSLPDLRQLRVYRLPVSGNFDGEANALDISRDAKYIAVGCETNGSHHLGVYVLDRATGRVVTYISGLAQEAECCRFSANGKELAIGLGTGGFEIWSVPGGYYVSKDDTFYIGLGGAVRSLDYDRAGNLAVLAQTQDGGCDIRVYDSDTKLLVKKAIEGKEPSSIRFSADGHHLALTREDTQSVAILSAKSLATERTLQSSLPPAKDSGLWFADWLPDGGIVAAGGDGHRTFVVRWPRGLSKSPAPHDFALSQLSAFAELPTGQLAVASPFGFGLLSLNDAMKTWRPVTAASINGAEDRFLASRDGEEVGLPNGMGYLDFSIGARRLVPSKSALVGLLPTLLKVGTFDPKAALKERDSHDPGMYPEDLNIFAVLPDGSGYLSSIGFDVWQYSKAGEHGWSVSFDTAVLAINVTRDGRLALLFCGDGTVRWIRTKDGEPLLTLFVQPVTRQWVAWTPSGYYDCSPGGSDLVGWLLNRDSSHLADFFPAARFSREYYNPGVVGEVLKTLDEGQAIALTLHEEGIMIRGDPSFHELGFPDVAPPTVTAPAPIGAVLPPVVTILGEDGQGFDVPAVTVKYTVRTPTREPITKIEYCIDGRPAKTDSDLALVATDEVTRQTTMTLPRRDANISIMAFNKFGASEPAVISLHFRGTGLNSAPPIVVQPKLYIVAVGIGAYADSDLGHLKYPADDARAFASSFVKQKGGLYKDVEVYQPALLDRAATTKAILDGLDWLRNKTTPDDVAILFIAGHGETTPLGEYKFLPTDYDPSHGLSTTVPVGAIAEVVGSVRGKLLVFIDTCYAGAASGKTRGSWSEDVSGLVNQLARAENGAVVLTACGNREFAEERDAWGHGAFTFALLEALAGKAARKDGSITFLSLYEYIKDRVASLTHDAQHPNLGIPTGARDFPIALSPAK